MVASPKLSECVCVDACASSASSGRISMEVSLSLPNNTRFGSRPCGFKRDFGRVDKLIQRCGWGLWPRVVTFQGASDYQRGYCVQRNRHGSEPTCRGRCPRGGGGKSAGNGARDAIYAEPWVMFAIGQTEFEGRVGWAPTIDTISMMPDAYTLSRDNDLAFR